MLFSTISCSCVPIPYHTAVESLLAPSHSFSFSRILALFGVFTGSAGGGTRKRRKERREKNEMRDTRILSRASAQGEGERRERKSSRNETGG